MRSVLLVCILFQLSSLAHSLSNEFKTTLQDAKNLGQEKNNQFMRDVQSFKPETQFDQYTDHPKETKYYKGVESGDADQLLNDGWQKRDELAGNVTESIKNRPHYHISPTDRDISKSQLIEKEADQILHGIKSQYVDCKEKKSCDVHFEKKYCESTHHHSMKICHKELDIQSIKKTVHTHYPLTLTIRSPILPLHEILISALTGKMISGPSFLFSSSVELSPTLPANIDCHRIHSGSFHIDQKMHFNDVESIEYPSCANGMILKLTLSGTNWVIMQIRLDIGVDQDVFELKDEWKSDCDSIIQDHHCELKVKTCDEQNITKTIHGASIKRDCWRETLAYQCAINDASGSCEKLKQSGCSQIGSECTEAGNTSICLRHRDTYQCPINQCDENTNIICGNGKEYCINGECAETEFQKNKDFGRAVSALGAINDAGKQIDAKQLTIFSGTPMKCTETMLGFSDCCDMDGWGHDLGLATCSNEEKKLRGEFKNKRVTYLGRYCSDDDFGFCTEHAKRFCVFNSKLAKIIQEQGRGQLNKSFGSAENPDCRGLTPEELQKIDLSRIDFSDFFEEIQGKMKKTDLDTIQHLIQNQVEHMRVKGEPQK